MLPLAVAVAVSISVGRRPSGRGGFVERSHRLSVLLTLRAAVLEWDEPSAWALIWALASVSELLLLSK